MTGPRSTDDATDRDGDEESVTCAECGTAVDTSSWYPVVGCGESSYDIYHFCGRTCRDAWTDQRC